MADPTAAGTRRTDLLVETQGRRLDEAYLHPSIRNDLKKEADDNNPDSLVTHELIDQLEEYMDLNEGAGIPAGVFTSGETSQQRAFFSTDAVVIVPGFLASSLSDTQRGGLGLIWVSRGLYNSNRFGQLRLGTYDANEADLNRDARIVSTGGLPLIYDVLRLLLESLRYNTSTFGVDWRKDLEIAANGLRNRIKELAQQRYPVHIVAHSQGAMVARRSLQLLKQDVGEVEAKRIVKNLVMLGPANAGSFSAPLAISGDHDSIPMLRKLTVEPTGGFRDVFATMSGIYQLMPWDQSRLQSLGNRDHAIGQPDFWKTMPWVDLVRLEKFYGWANRIDTTYFNDRTTVILGDYDGLYGRKTSAEVVVEKGHLKVTRELPGDGTVPHCNAVLKGTRTLMAKNSDHMLLPTYRKVVQAVRYVLNGDDPLTISDVVAKPDDSSADEYHV